MAYSDIDSGKVLNKEGLLELCSQIKTEIANNSGGGASYTAGDGINIDANDVISLKSPANDLANLFFILLKNSVGITNIGSLQNKIYYTPTNKSNTIDALLKGYIINAQSGYNITQSDLGLTSNIIFLDFWTARNNKSFNITSIEAKTSHNLVAGRFYFYSNSLLVEWRNPVDIWSQLPLYTPDNTYSTLGAYLTTLASRIPSAPTTDGTYKLISTVASGTPTYSWDTDSGGGTTYTAGTGISIVNGVISLDLATAEEGEF